MRWERDQAVFAYSRTKLLGYGILSAAAAVLCSWLWWKGAAPSGSFKELVLMLGGPLCGIAAIIFFARMFADPQVLTIDRQGILDKRISGSKLPWPMIAGLSVRSVHRQKFLMVELLPQFEASLQKTRLARVARANAAIGMKGRAISTNGLNGTMDDLLAAVRLFSGR